MRGLVFLALIFSLTFKFPAYESPQKIREVIFLWENGHKAEALKAIETSAKYDKEEFSYAIYLFSLNLYKKGETSYAKKFLKKSLEINPGLWRGWSLLSFAELKSGNVHLFFKYLPRTFIAFLKDFKNQVIIFSILLKSFYISTLCALFVLSAFLLIKYLPLVRDDISHLIGEISFKSRKFLSYLIIFLLPAIFFLGWALTAIIWIAFVWPFLKNKERRVAIIAILIVFLAIIGNNISTSLTKEIADFTLSENKDLAKNWIYYSFYAKEIIERGEFEKAINILNEINERNPNLFSLVTLGNIRLKEGKFEESRKLYEKALMLFPNSNIPYSNLSILFKMTGEIQYAEKYKQKAKALKGESEEIIWPELSSVYAWKSTLKERLNSKNTLSLDLFLIIGVILGGILLNVILKLSPTPYGESRFCLSCRKSINIHYDLKITNPDYCEDCYKLFIWKPPELEIVRASKSREIKMRKLKELGIYRIISIFIPYSGLIRYDNSPIGYLGFTIFAFFLSTAILLKEMEAFSLPLTSALLSVIVYLISIFTFEKKVEGEWKEL